MATSDIEELRTRSSLIDSTNRSQLQTFEMDCTLMHQDIVTHYSMLCRAIRTLGLRRGQEYPILSENTLLNTELGISSLDLVNLLVELENDSGEAFNFDRMFLDPEGECRGDLTIGEVVRCLSE